jgi:hypothetical protein
MSEEFTVKQIEYHDDSRCALCGGPLECHRDAVCTACVPDTVWWDLAAAAQKAARAAGGEG